MIFNDWFETVELDNEEETPPQWDVIVTSSTFMANLDPEDLDGYELDDEWLPNCRTHKLPKAFY